MTGDDKFFRTRQVVQSEYGVQCDDVLDALEGLVPADEVERIRKAAGQPSFSDVVDALKAVEAGAGTPILVSVLQSSKIFLSLMKKQSGAYPVTYGLHRRLAETYPLGCPARRKEDQGTLDVGIRGRVVARFAPEPSGYLHIGHARAALLNNHYVTESGGKLIVRFDDTNPLKETEEFEHAILEDLGVLGIEEFLLSHTSDYFDRIIELGKALIRHGKAYCDDTDRERIRAERDEGVESRRRGTDVATNLAVFEEMVVGRKRDYCLRAKIDMKNCNKAMRDPVMFRCADVRHYRMGDRHRVYPTYDFACPVVDSMEGVTHALRTNEFRDRNAQYRWFVEALGLENVPKIVDFARLNFEDTVMSKRKLRHFVESEGIAWDDPRMPTIRGVRRRGLRMDVLREYILMQGVPQKPCVVSWDKVWAMNKRRVDKDAPRYFCVKRKACVRARVLGHEPWTNAVPVHRKNEALGTKDVFYGAEILIDQEDAALLEEGEEFTLMHWSNAVLTGKTVESGVVTRAVVTLNPHGDFKATRHKLNWVSLLGSTAVSLVEYGSLTTGRASDLDSAFNRDSKTSEECLAESAVSAVSEGTVIQFERLGFYYADGGFTFNLVPFTKQARTH